MKRKHLGAFALLAIAVLTALAGWAVHALTNVFIVRVAAGPSSSFGGQFATSLVHLMALDHPRVRVRVINFPTEAEATNALNADQADFVVARADRAPTDGLSTVIVRRSVAVFILPHGSKISDIPGLRGHAIGVAGTDPDTAKILGMVMKSYDAPANQPAPVPLATATAVTDAFRTHKVSAVFVVTPLAGPLMSQTLAAVRTGGGGAPSVVVVDETDSIVARNPVMESVDLPKGILQGAPPLPDDDSSTLGVSTRLFASSRVPNILAAEMTRILLTDKAKVANLMPAGTLIDAPDTDKVNPSLPLHPGTALYLSGNQPSLSDQAQNLLYWLGLLASAVASSTAAIMALLRRFRPRPPDAILELLDLWVKARETDAAGLATAERAVDDLVQHQARLHAEGKDSDESAVFPLLVGQVRRAIDRRRLELDGQARAVPPAGEHA